jgi:branched-chain amino acid transport system permease protein
VTVDVASPHTAAREKRDAPMLPQPWPVVIFLLVLAVGLLIGVAINSTFAQTIVFGLVAGSTYASLAVALVLIYRATGVFNFAQGEMAMATTYVLYQLHDKWHVTYWLAFPIMLAFAFVFGVFIYTFFIRPVERRSVIAVIIVTIALFVLIDGVVGWVFGNDTLYLKQSPFPTSIIGGQTHSGHPRLGIIVEWQQLGTFLTTLGSVFLVWLLFRFTKLGLGMRAAAFRPASARLSGIRVPRMLAIGWGLAAMLGAVSGVMIAGNSYDILTVPLVQPVLLFAFVAAVVGGLESPIGAVVGSLLFGVILALLGRYVGFFGAGSPLQTPFALIVLLIVLLFKPEGLFGKPEVKRV